MPDKQLSSSCEVETQAKTPSALMATANFAEKRKAALDIPFRMNRPGVISEIQITPRGEEQLGGLHRNAPGRLNGTLWAPASHEHADICVAREISIDELRSLTLNSSLTQLSPLPRCSA